jgi:hypothetical protein
MALVSGLVLFFVLVCLIPGPAATTRQGKRTPPTKLELALLKAAKDAYPRVLDRETGDKLIEMERNYLWSKRLLEVEREVHANNKELVAAFKGHLDRMMNLEAQTKEHEWRTSGKGRRPYKAYQLGVLAAVAFYRAEAEVLLERAKSKQ